MAACWRQDILHVAPQWRHQGARYDYIAMQGARAGHILFAQVYAMFTLRFCGSELPIALVRIFRSIGRNKLTNYPELKDMGNVDFIFLDAIVRAAHVIPPTTDNPHFTVQDLADSDMYLRLLSLK